MRNGDRLGTWLAVFSLPLAFGLALLVAKVPLAGLLLTAPIVVVLVAFKPRTAILVAIPLLMLPIPVEVAGTSVQYPLLAVLEVGVIFGCARNIKRLSLLTWLVAVTCGLLVTSLLLHDRYLVTQSAAVNGLAAMLLCIGLVLAVALAAPEPGRLLKTVVLSGVASSIYTALFGQLSVTGRLASEELNANSAGHVAAITIVGLIALAVESRKFGWVALAIPPVYVLIGSMSRAAFVIVAVGVGVLYLARLTGKSRFLLSTVVAVGLVALWAPVEATGGLNFTAGRSDNAAEASTQQRSILLQLAFRLILESPISGIGYRAFPDRSAEVLRVGFNTHNDYLRIAVEAGLPALAGLVLIGVLAVRKAPAAGPLRAVALALVAGTSTSFLFGNTMSLLAVALPVWLVLGSLWAQRRRVPGLALDTDRAVPVVPHRP